MSRANHCDKCDAPTANHENEYGEFVCDNCADNAAEAAWERKYSNLNGDDAPLPLIEQQIQARRLK